MSNSSEETDFLISQYEEHTEHGRHTESERSTITTIVITAQAAVLTFLGTKDFKPEEWWMALLIVFFGIYGLTMCLILNNRYDRHRAFFTAFRQKLEGRLSGAGVPAIRMLAGNKVKKRGSLHLMLPVLHILTTVGGIILATILLISSLKQPSPGETG